jgi:hypothetical protein
MLRHQKASDRVEVRLSHTFYHIEGLLVSTLMNNPG